MLLGGMFLPQAGMVKQLLMASGLKDPAVLKMADTILSGGFGTPTVAKLNTPSLQIPDDAETIVASAQNADTELTVIVVSRKKPQKALDAAA